jgi:hypothetical protein
MVKIAENDILKMSSRELSDYIIEITQTEICKDKKYCDFLLKHFVSIKPII